MEVYESSRGRIVRHEDRSEYRVACAQSGEGGQFDWGQPFTQSNHDRVMVAVQFKNGRRDYYVNGGMLSLHVGDVVCVSSSPGYDVGMVSLTGWLAQRDYLRAHGENRDEQRGKILRKAAQCDVERWLVCIEREQSTMLRAREVASGLGLQMKIVDVEYQGDGTKASFYYSAEKRVDFRELVRMLATEFRVRVEMRQIGPRQEAGRVGGIGTCGQSLCCCKWLHQYVPVTTSTVKMQDMTPNPQKQAGQCGKLKCCLNFEVDYYADARKRFPRLRTPLQLEGQNLFHAKNDLFRDYMWFSTEPRGAGRMVMLTLAQVEQIMALNAEGKLAAPLSELDLPQRAEAPVKDGYDDVIVEESITRFDNRTKPSKNRKPHRRKRPNAGQQHASK